MSRLHQSRIADFQEVLGEPTVALAKLRELCFSGIPFDGGLRCLCWKILLNYLPLEKALWSSLLKKQRDLYSQFLKEMIIQPGIAKANLGVSREDVTLEDHPLNPSPDSRWNNYFKDNEVLLQIDKDVRRLYPDMAFFQRPTDYPCLLVLDPQSEFETLRRRVEQTTLKAQPVARSRSGFTNQEQNIKPQFFAFRWLTLLLSQEFLLPDVIRIWDSLFADAKRFDFLLLVCCAMLTLIRDQLLEGDFTLNMRLLQDYPISDVHLILKKAKELQDSK
ncbi:TBC1 domain family member 13 isoform X2 [Indicator indicator]|uniref:TBC1 domain family member 13 isoform X2 n=1 Tax=Indicator indicator TaxID=1002788 RepID=UPI0023DEB028|nr:TBC1 domain family member 13 isoform X2 [Indicator indicator]